MTNNNKTGLIIASAVLVLLVVMSGIVMNNKKQAHNFSLSSQLKIDGLILPQARVIADFSMTTTQGKPFSKQHLLGHWNLVFFGFTNCAFVCPTTLSELNKMYLQLQKDLKPNELPQIVMVSVDPERDTLARFNSYLSQFNPAFIGLRASTEQLNAFAAQLNATYSKIMSSDGNSDHYTMTHTADIMILDPNGNLRGFLSYPHQSDELVQDYELILKAAHQ